MSRDQSYGERLLANIREQMVVRGIDLDEFDDVCAQIAESYKIDALTSMHGGQLRHVQQHIGEHFRRYLGGAKRAAGVGSIAWPETATSAAVMEAGKAGIPLSAIEGSGKDGTITKGDVAAAVDTAAALAEVAAALADEKSDVVTITADDVAVVTPEELGL